MRTDTNTGIASASAAPVARPIFNRCRMEVSGEKMVVVHRETGHTDVIGPRQDESPKGFVNYCPWCDAVD